MAKRGKTGKIVIIVRLYAFIYYNIYSNAGRTSIIDTHTPARSTHTHIFYNHCMHFYCNVVSERYMYIYKYVCV